MLDAGDGGHALEGWSPGTDSVLSWIARIQHWCVFCYFGLEKLEKENSVGHFDDGSKVSQKKILVSKKHMRTQTLNMFGAFAESRKKATISFVLSACQLARPRETARFPVHRLL